MLYIAACSGTRNAFTRYEKSYSAVSQNMSKSRTWPSRNRVKFKQLPLGGPGRLLDIVRVPGAFPPRRVRHARVLHPGTLKLHEKQLGSSSKKKFKINYEYRK